MRKRDTVCVCEIGSLLLLTFSRKLDTINFVKKVHNYYLNLLLKNENVWSEVSHPRIKAKKHREARLMNLGR